MKYVKRSYSRLELRYRGMRKRFFGREIRSANFISGRENSLFICPYLSSPHIFIITSSLSVLLQVRTSKDFLLRKLTPTVTRLSC